MQPDIAYAAVEAAHVLALRSCPEMTGLQVAAGFVTWMNVLKVFAIALGAACVTFLFFRSIKALLGAFLSVPLAVYETLGYLVSVGLVASTSWTEGENRLWPLLGGSLLFAGTLLVSAKLRGWKGNPSGFWGVLFLAWTAVALAFGSSHVGFLAVAAGISALGFSAAVSPLCFAFGFKNEESIPGATFAALLALAAFIAAKATGFDLGPLKALEQGAFWVGGFVGFIGLLIVASKWYGSNGSYVFRQFLLIACAFAAVAAGNLFGVPQASGIGGTFLVLYLVQKPFEIPVESATGVAVIGLLVASVLGGAVWWAQNHMDLVQPYLLF